MVLLTQPADLVRNYETYTLSSTSVLEIKITNSIMPSAPTPSSISISSLSSPSLMLTRPKYNNSKVALRPLTRSSLTSKKSTFKSPLKINDCAHSSLIRSNNLSKSINRVVLRNLVLILVKLYWRKSTKNRSF